MYDGVELDDAVDTAIEYCILNDVLKDYLSAHRAEAREMILSEYNEEKVMELLKKQYSEAAYDAGLEAGKLEGMREVVTDLVRSGELSAENGAKRLGITVEELLKMV